MTYDEQIAILQAAKAGKVIQFGHDAAGWSTWTQVNFDFVRYKYRVKPDPKRCWVKFGDDGRLVSGAVEDIKMYGYTEMVEAME